MICSVLIPTRKRPAQLCRAVESVLATSDPSKVEVLLWFDRDDSTYDEIKGRYFHAWRNVYFFQGLAHQSLGYEGLHWYYDYLAQRANGQWIFIFNDDAVIKGVGWDQQLAEVPRTGFIVHPQFHCLNASQYRTETASPFPFVPLNCWHPFCGPHIPGMVDTAFDQMLRVQNGWQVRLLNGVTVQHYRIIDETLPKHRF